ncbi:MAG: hypothetical protein JWQ50_5715 [Caballeronia mineralivorans]|nr:hypothetical protein [Caballeronia mineralivorans]
MNNGPLRKGRLSIGRFLLSANRESRATQGQTSNLTKRSVKFRIPKALLDLHASVIEAHHKIWMYMKMNPFPRQLFELYPSPPV